MDDLEVTGTPIFDNLCRILRSTTWQACIEIHVQVGKFAGVFATYAGQKMPKTIAQEFGRYSALMASHLLLPNQVMAPTRGAYAPWPRPLNNKPSQPAVSDASL